MLLVLGSSCASEREPGTRVDGGTTQPPAASEAADAAREGPRPRDAGHPADADAAAFVPLSEVERGRLPCLPADAGECRRGVTWQWSALVKATQFGAGARLLTVGGDAVLAEASDGTHRVGWLGPAESDQLPPELTISTLPPGVFGIDIATHAGSRLDGLFVLVCEGERCRLLNQKRSPEGAKLQDLPGAVITEGTSVRGLAVDTFGDALCVYGDGMRCFDGTWREVLPAALKIRKVDANDRGPTMMAWTDDGRVVVRTERAGTWEEGRAPMLGAARGTAMLSWSTLNAATAIVFGEGGWSASGPTGAPDLCALDGDVRALFPTPDYRFAELVLASGELWAFATESGARPAQWCKAQQLALDEVIATSASTCGLANNARVLTPSVLVGTQLCPID